MLSVSYWRAQSRAEHVIPVSHTAKHSEIACLKARATERNKVLYPLPPPVQSPSHAASPHLALADSSHSHCRGVSIPGHASQAQTLPLCLLLTRSAPPAKLSPQSSTWLALVEGCAEPGGRVCAVRRCFPPLPDVCRQAGSPSQHPPAAHCSQTGATGGQKNQQ